MGGRGFWWFGSALAAAWLTAAAPAVGLESVSGTYEVKQSCKVFGQGAQQVVKSKGLMLPILDLGGGLARTHYGSAATHEGYVRAETEKPSRGWLSAVSCHNLVDSIIHFEVSMKPSGAVQLKGSVLQAVPADGATLSCQLRGKRVSTDPPVIPACP
jgi:hypothetical protein